ncbi:MAG: hypothetical protein AAGH43_12490 [Pseudomonadota bacterium]
MPITNYGLEMMGFKKLPEGEVIRARFYSLHLYSIRGIILDESEVEFFKWDIGREEIELGIGDDLNRICEQICNDNWSDDLESWQKERRCNPPYIMIKIGPTEEYSVSDAFVQDFSDGIMSHDAFSEAKNILTLAANEVLPRALASLDCIFSRLKNTVDFRAIESLIVGKSASGKTVKDVRFDMTGSGYTSGPLADENLKEMMNDCATLANSIESKAARFLDLALREDDPLKSFLFFFLSIEVTTHMQFKKIDHCSSVDALLRSDERIFKSANALFLEQSKSIKSLRGKFIWCAVNRWKGMTDDDVEAFARSKKTRDDIAHGNNIEISDHQLKEIRQLAESVTAHSYSRTT